MIRADGQRGLVCGVYRIVARPTRGDAPSPRDYAVVVLDDGAEVFLESFATPQAIRSEAERYDFGGRYVCIEGVVHRRMPVRGQGPLAPCVSDIARIETSEPPDDS